MRWTRGSEFVGISLGLVGGGRENVWVVDTNLDWETLPIECRTFPKETDSEGYEELRSALAEWAARNGFS